MKKTIALLIIIFCMFGCAVDKTASMPLVANFRMLLPIISHNVTATIHAPGRMVFLKDDIRVDREKIKNQYSASIVINKNISLEDIYVNGIPAMVREVVKYDENYFGNSLTKKQLESIEEAGRIYEIELPPYKNGEEEIIITIKYLLKFSGTKNDIGHLSADSFELFNEFWWIPSVLTETINGTLVVNSPKRFDIKVNENKGKVDDSSVLRKTTFSLDSIKSEFVLSNKR